MSEARGLDSGDRVIATGGPHAGRRGVVAGWHDDKHFLVKWDDGDESVPWVGFLARVPKVGEGAKCVVCGLDGVVVCTVNAGFEDDFDEKLAKSVAVPLEISAHGPGLTCRTCEAQRFRDALPQRGVCANCGLPNASATSKDLGATRSFCDDRCINEFVNARLKDEGHGKQA